MKKVVFCDCSVVYLPAVAENFSFFGNIWSYLIW